MVNSSSQIFVPIHSGEMTRTSHTMRSGEYGFDYMNPVYGRTAIKAKAAQKTNVIFAICKGRATMNGKPCEFLGGGELVKRCDPMVEARVMNQLQKWKKSGQTAEQLENTLKTPQAKILIVLELYKEEGRVTKSENGVWTLVRGRTPDQSPARHAGDDSNDAV